jgi:phosphohistidine phosphatase SixA
MQILNVNEMLSKASMTSFSVVFIKAILAASLSILSSPTLSKESDRALWQQLRSGGHVLLIRHADAPGTFDPPGFQLGDCATQRNLSAKGREQAKRIGEQLAEEKIPIGTVFSSQWCRCVDTATLAFGASKVQLRPEISSPTKLSDERRKSNAEVMRKLILTTTDRSSKSAPNSVYVTHNFNIQDILGISVEEGEMVIARFDEKQPTQPLVIGRIRLGLN